MNGHIQGEFEAELRTFFVLSLMNLVFAALATAFGVSIIVQQATVLSRAGDAALSLPGSWMVLVLAFLAALLGLRWITASARILRGVQEIRDSSAAAAARDAGEEITGLIIAMITFYRENRGVIGRMILVCTLGGCCFLMLGFLNGIEFISAGLSSGTFTIDLQQTLLIPSALLSLMMGMVSLVDSYLFRRYTGVWNRRMEEIAHSEAVLQRSIEEGGV